MVVRPNIWDGFLLCGQYLQFCGLHVIAADKYWVATGSATKKGDVIRGCTLHNITRRGMRSYCTVELGFIMAFAVFCMLRTGETINTVVDRTVVSSKWFCLEEILVMHWAVEPGWLFQWEVRVLGAKLGNSQMKKKSRREGEEKRGRKSKVHLLRYLEAFAFMRKPMVFCCPLHLRIHSFLKIYSCWK